MRIVPRAEVTRRWKQWESERMRKMARRDVRPRTINTETARSLTDTRERVFRGRKYRVPPLGFELAAEVLEHADKLQEIQSAPSRDWAALTAWFIRAAELAKRGCVPSNPLRRLLWRLTPNPFRRGTLQEVADLLGFISAWVMIELAPRPTRNGDRLGTSPQTSRDS